MQRRECCLSSKAIAGVAARRTVAYASNEQRRRRAPTGHSYPCDPVCDQAPIPGAEVRCAPRRKSSRASSRPAAVTTSTGTPSASTRVGRSRRSHVETRRGRVEMITRSYVPSDRAARTASKGSPLVPVRPSTGPLAARPSSGNASSSVQSVCSLLGASGMSNANVVGRAHARRFTASNRSGVAAVRLATTRMRRCDSDSMTCLHWLAAPSRSVARTRAVAKARRTSASGASACHGHFAR